MSTFDMNNATDVALKIDVYAIYLLKSRADLEAEKLGEGEPSPGIEKQMNDQVVLENQDMQNEENEE